jgi:hypothetical protein
MGVRTGLGVDWLAAAAFAEDGPVMVEITTPLASTRGSTPETVAFSPFR